MSKSEAIVMVGWMALSACARSHDVPATALPPELAVPAGATNVVARRDGEMAAVEYEIAAPYPAEEFLTLIDGQLRAVGWKAMERDLLNPSIPTSNVRGWTSFVDPRKSPHLAIHQWSGDWRNQKGDVVSYSLRYTTPAGDSLTAPPVPDNSRLHVTAFRIPASQAEQMKARAAALQKR
jgi:hypothetical protein